MVDVYISLNASVHVMYNLWVLDMEQAHEALKTCYRVISVKLHS